ncbi:hypothetical protein IWW56_001249 [Coemansia sp. RSA 2131]|nr:hypothetical protein IWW56_001249 [Coemansia sp. RSA 2131]
MCQDNEPSIRHMEYNFCRQQLSKKTNSYVKTVTLFLTWTNVFSGAALEMLNQLYPNLTFPRARHVRVFFSAPFTKQVESSSQTMHDIEEFTHRVRNMVPHAHSIQATVYSFGYMAVPHEFKHCSRVLNNLCSQLRSAEYHGWGNPQWHGILADQHTELTNLTYDWMNFGEESYALKDSDARLVDKLELPADMLQNWLATAPMLQTLKVLVDEPGIRKSLMACLPTISCAKTLHMLVIPHISLQFDKLLELICQLPALTDLHCGYSGLENALDLLDNRELVNYTCSVNQSRLKMWQVVNADAVAENTLALTAMLLAIALPNFTYAAIPPSMRACYEDNLREFMLQVPFVAYATRLECLFLKGAQI